MRKFIFLNILLTVFISGCKQSTEPQPVNDKPPGYQEDIPWPSLADSPWPMANHDPQATGRGKLSVNLSGDLARDYSVASLITGGSVSNNDFVYITSYGAFISLSIATDSLNKKEIGFIDQPSTPILLSGGLIYSYFDTKGICLLNSQGILQWNYIPESKICADNFIVDKHGNLLFITSEGSLISIDKNGNILFKYFNPGFDEYSQISFSPDGKTLYILNSKAKLFALDIINQSIKWTFGTSNQIINSNRPLVDSQGNIYFTTIDTTSNGELPAMFSISPEKEIRWFFVHRQWYKEFGKINISHSEPTMDKNGNLYFGSDTVYSISYEGKLNWKKKLNTSNTTSFICDQNGNIYLSRDIGTGDDIELFSINSQGDIIWQIIVQGETTNYSPSLTNNFLIYPTYSEFVYFIK